MIDTHGRSRPSDINDDNCDYAVQDEVRPEWRDQDWGWDRDAPATMPLMGDEHHGPRASPTSFWSEDQYEGHVGFQDAHVEFIEADDDADRGSPRIELETRFDGNAYWENPR